MKCTKCIWNDLCSKDSGNYNREDCDDFYNAEDIQQYYPEKNEFYKDFYNYIKDREN